jgi:Ubiquitin-2 like Rad60 SUMO-like
MSTGNDNGDSFAIPPTLKDRCMRSHGWSSDFTDRVIGGYRQFIKLKYQQEDWHASVLSPSLTVDLVWHEHILDVEHYVQACQDYAGHLIGHNPDGGLDAAAREERIKTTQLCLKTLYGKANVDSEVWEIGNEEEDEGKERTPKKQRTTSTQVKIKEEVGKEPITLRVRDHTGEDTFFKIRRGQKLEKVFQAYADRRGVDVKSFSFSLDGERLVGSSTPLMNSMDDLDQMDVLYVK